MQKLKGKDRGIKRKLERYFEGINLLRLEKRETKRENWELVVTVEKIEELQVFVLLLEC